MDENKKDTISSFTRERTLKDEIKFQKGVGPLRAKDLANLNIHTVSDILFSLPRNYIDRISSGSIADLELGERNVVIVKLEKVNQITHNWKRRQLQAIFTDGESRLMGIWFQYQKWQLDILKVNGLYKVEGKVSLFNGQLQMTHPKVDQIAFGYDEPFVTEDSLTEGKKLLPIYPSSGELTQSFFKKLIYQVYQNYIHLVNETITPEILYRNKLLRLVDSVKAVHFPESRELAERGRQRLVFEELFYHQLMLLRVKAKNEAPGRGIEFQIKKTYTTTLKNSLSFTLTSAQKRVIREIVEDMQSSKIMSRLLQGDVGSGKTIVALFSMLLAVENKYQAILLVPTEVLAKQHFQSIKRLLENQEELQIELILGGNNKAKREALERIESGESNIVIGTHALLEETVKYHNVGLVVIDEQQRFGVEQRAKLPERNNNPDVLYLTATPIPRSLALTFYGDLEVSVIDELPPNRKPVKTVVKSSSGKAVVYKELEEQLQKGRQIYIVCPIISESEKLDLLDAERLYTQLSEKMFTSYKVELIHSKVKAADKDEIMRRFKAKEIDILVATTVIEVGIDVPNASVMVIEHAERFGLSQLHQLRGRVGRGSEESYCYLIAYHPLSAVAKERLSVMTQTNDGFLIAEKDLELRGSGDFFGTSQSGIPLFKFADITKDKDILESARAEAKRVVSSDTELIDEGHRLIRENYSVQYKTREKLFTY
ncbi:MAG: ATP-dependent DNA helicase RecG [Candidatus Cloacimonadia bacterium]